MRSKATLALCVALAFITLLPLFQGALAAPSPSTPKPFTILPRQDSKAAPSDGMQGHFSSLSRDKWIGLGLAISSSLAIGTSFIITKKVGLHSCAPVEKHLSYWSYISS